MYATDDTIVAIATPLGRSGIGIVRLSGSSASTIASSLITRAGSLEPRRATFARLTAFGGAQAGPASSPISDQVVVTLFPAPQSYTGEDVVEISAHGSPVVLQAILSAAIAARARLAEPGEFTLRAFLNGKLDLVQAEAVADLIDAVTPLQARAAFDQLEGTLTTAIAAIESQLFDLMARLEASLDFPDEGYHFVASQAAAREARALSDRIDALLVQSTRGRLIREGAQVAIVGTPNVGKSSLFNALVRANRAIVTEIPGTTRDLLSERANLAGFSVALVDTAGVRETDDVIEREGVLRARGAAAVADLTILVLDASRRLSDDDHAIIDATSSTLRVVVLNKIDLPAAWSPAIVESLRPIAISVKSGAGVEALIDRIAEMFGGSVEKRDSPQVTNLRHMTLLECARAALARAVEAMSQQTISEEFVLADLQEASAHLQEITGRRTTDELLHHIFRNFCIGK